MALVVIPWWGLGLSVPSVSLWRKRPPLWVVGLAFLFCGYFLVVRSAGLGIELQTSGALLYIRSTVAQLRRRQIVSPSPVRRSLLRMVFNLILDLVISLDFSPEVHPDVRTFVGFGLVIIVALRFSLERFEDDSELRLFGLKTWRDAFRPEIFVGWLALLLATSFISSVLPQAPSPELQAAVTVDGGLIVPSPDGILVASVRDQRVEIVSAGDGRPLRTLESTGRLRSVVWSPDAKKLAGGLPPLTIWDSTTGRVVRRLGSAARQQSVAVASLAWSPDGRVLAAGLTGGDVEVWDTDTPQLVRILHGHSGEVTSLTFSRDGKVLASASQDQAIRVWNAATGEVLQRLGGNLREVRSLAFTPNGRQLASGGDGLILWDLDLAAPQGLRLTANFLRRVSQTSKRQLGIGLAPVDAVASSPDGRLLASASTERIEVWELAGGKLVATLRGHTERVTFVAFSAGGRTLVSAGEDKCVRWWDVSGF